MDAFVGSGAPPAVECALLGAVPEPWEGWPSIAVMRRLGLLIGSVWFKLWRAAAPAVVGAENLGTLRYDDGAGGDLLRIAPGAEALLAAAQGDGTGGGGNNWAVGPARSATGRPVLAGDPHRVFEIANMYAQHRLACAEFDLAGVREVAILRDGARRVIVPATALWDDFLAATGVDLGERSQPAH
ncbi:penicillin acylase family protein [Dankookia rubra]|uniref:penicillin acylase family protein n=1 Tax=Dankookia rubra TaxID=1442381 RepID=UPI001877CF86|nr:penicillin acylase family protein [Dankookia rubra]